MLRGAHEPAVAMAARLLAELLPVPQGRGAVWGAEGTRGRKRVRSVPPRADNDTRWLGKCLLDDQNKFIL